MPTNQRYGGWRPSNLNRRADTPTGETLEAPYEATFRADHASPTANHGQPNSNSYLWWMRRYERFSQTFWQDARDSAQGARGYGEAFLTQQQAVYAAQTSMTQICGRIANRTGGDDRYSVVMHCGSRRSVVAWPRLRGLPLSGADSLWCAMR